MQMKIHRLQIGDIVEYTRPDGFVVRATIENVYGVEEPYFAVCWEDHSDVTYEYTAEDMFAFLHSGPYAQDFFERIKERLG